MRSMWLAIALASLIVPARAGNREAVISFDKTCEVMDIYLRSDGTGASGIEPSNSCNAGEQLAGVNVSDFQGMGPAIVFSRSNGASWAVLFVVQYPLATGGWYRSYVTRKDGKTIKLVETGTYTATSP